ncbi:MAG TPA: TonB-dependent receptor, partial [Gemmatimonadaceae bacterium]
IDGTGTLVYGIFDDVDVRSEARFDDLTTEFTQVTLDAEHSFSDSVRVHGLAGFAESNHENPIQTTLLFDANNIDGYTYDYRGDDRLPLITYGATDVTSPATWTLSQIRLRPQSSINSFSTFSADLEYSASESFGVQFGAQWKEYEFKTTEQRRSNGTTANLETVIPANVAATPVASYSELTTFGDGLGVPSGTPTTWLIPDLNAAASLFGLYDPSVFRMGIEPALGNNATIKEEDTGGWVQFDWNVEMLGRPLRGNVGVRYVETKQETTGYTFTSGSPLLQTVERTYDNTLPSLNMVFEATDEFLIRIGAAKTMTRPPLGNLSPGAVVSVSGNNRTVTAGNPQLDPFEADNYDLAFEWYFAEESLVAVALFYKDIGSFIQTIRSTMPFTGNPLGLPDSVAIAACGATPGCTPDADWQFSLPANTPGGELKGFEISYQQPFTFLPAPFDGFGAILNYTGVESDVQYLDATGAVVTTANLTGLSESAYNATIYFENERFSARVSAAYRDEYLTTVPGRNGNDIEGTAETLNIDAAASFTLNDNIEFTLEALNLTDEFQDQWVDSLGDRLSYYHHTGREYFLGARFRF